ncbi:amino acid permease [Athelia psychrophila]|uniref:Amino acid permease n=1 Tax=Athelia psychrophila TaxID=1759441 RepID=A0A167T0P0_9AGAM|nr:amino acid permease [Fibularhizoctonia sp. CBS 109695]
MEQHTETGSPTYDHEKASYQDDGIVRGEAKAGANVVTLGGLDARAPDGAVQRRLKARHISMIAIGGTIGTGLFVGSGAALATGGPVGLLLGYAIMGTVVYSMMVALGEMATLFPVSGSFTHYATRWVDPALGFALGYNYWYSYAITLPTEITAAAIVISYWDKDTNPGAWIAIFLVVIVAINFAGVRYYGEAEFWFSFIKVITIVGLIIMGIVLDLGGGPTHDRIGFRYWKNPGAFTQLNGIPGTKGRFLAFWATFVNAAFSFLGTEIVALAAGEAENPRRNVPKAIRRVFYRILLFYIGGVIVIGWLVPYNDPRLLSKAANATASPFVIAISNAKIKALPSIINAVILISAFSAGNSDLYAASRTLYGLACSGQAPRFLRKCTKAGLPIYCVGITSLGGLLAFLNVSGNGNTVFEWFVNITSITGLITWDIILVTYIRFHKGLKYQGIDRNTLPYKAPFQPYASYFGVLFVTLVIFFNGFQVFLAGEWDVNIFITAYICLPIFLVLYVGYKVVVRPKFVRVEDMDFTTGRRELNDMEEEEDAKYVAPTTWYGIVWDWLM